jgi:hypothetical protein
MPIPSGPANTNEAASARSPPRPIFFSSADNQLSWTLDEIPTICHVPSIF